MAPRSCVSSTHASSLGHPAQPDVRSLCVRSSSARAQQPDRMRRIGALTSQGPVTPLNLRVVRFAEIGRREQSYTDADARSAHTHQFRALPSHQPPTHECPRALAGLVIGWPLSSVA